MTAGLFFCGLSKSINFETQDFVAGDVNVGLPNNNEEFRYRFLGVKSLNLLGDGDQFGLFEYVLSHIHRFKK